MLLPAQRQIILSPPAWVLNGGGVSANLDLWFERGLLYQRGIGETQGVGVLSNPQRYLTCSRASVGYIDNTSGLWTSIGNNLPRISNKGLLVEEARTNSIRNNSMQGAVAGTPGTAPTNWTVDTTTSGITRTIGGPSSTFGIDTLQVKYAGTPSLTTALQQVAEQGTQIAATPGQVWTVSWFIGQFAGNTTNLSALDIRIQWKDSGGATLSETVSSSLLSALTSSPVRFSVTGTAPASTAFVTTRIRWGITNGSAIDCALEVGWPQLELGAFATSPIRTTSAAVTRAADVVTVTRVPVFGSAYTIFGKGTPNAPNNYATNQAVVSIDDGTTNNKVQFIRGSVTAPMVPLVATAGVLSLNSGIGTWNQFTSKSGAVTDASGDQAAVFAGSAAQTGTVAGVPVVTTIHIGTRFDGTVQLNGYIERVALWLSSRLPNADLQRLTA